MKSLKRALAVLGVLIMALLLSYLIYTGKKAASITDTTEIARAVMGGYYG